MSSAGGASAIAEQGTVAGGGHSDVLVPQQVIIPAYGGSSHLSGTGLNSQLPDPEFADGGYGSASELEYFWIGSAEFAQFLAFLSDNLILNAFEETPSSALLSSTTYLQRLCEQGGTPLHVCQSRYGQ